MSATAISIVVGVASVVIVALTWRVPITRHSVLTLAVMVNVGMAQVVPSQADQARLVSWSVSATLIVVGLLRSKREHLRQPALYLWGLAAVFLAASYFLAGVSPAVQRGLLIALGATTGLAMLASLISVTRLMRADTTRRA